MFMKYDRDPKTDLGLEPTSMKLAEGGGVIGCRRSGKQYTI